MFAGIQEVLVLAIIILAILFLPKILPRAQGKTTPEPIFKTLITRLSGRMRLAIIFSLIWPLLTAGYFQPWKKEWLAFLYVGIGPVILSWSLRWVIEGFRKKR